MPRYLAILALSISSLLAAPPADISDGLAEILKGSEIPALAAAAVVNDDIVAAGATGIRKIGDETKVTIDDKFHLGSNTKSMTATLAAIMVRDGKIKWDTTVEESFPRLRKINPEFAKATLEQLLSNTGGCPKDVPAAEWSSLDELRGSLPRHREALAKIVLIEKPSYPPGKGYEYSNAGFSIGGAMLEHAAKESYEDLLSEHLFKPLEMTSAGFRAPGKNRRVEHPYGHRRVPLTGKIVPVDPEPHGDNPAAIAPAGAVHCTIIDHAKYARAHLGHGPKGFLTDEELAILHQPRAEDYAMGWKVGKQPWSNGPSLSHAGSNTMWYSVIWVAPKRGFAAVAACNIKTDEAVAKCNEAILYLLEHHLPK